MKYLLLSYLYGHGAIQVALTTGKFATSQRLYCYLYLLTMATEQFWTRLEIRLGSLSSANGSCTEFKGSTDRYGYGRMKVNWQNGADPVMVGTHRLCFMIRNKIVPSNMPEGDVSHICHNKLCIKYDHLVLEPAHINKEREHCRHQKEGCTRSSPIVYLTWRLVSMLLHMSDP